MSADKEVQAWLKRTRKKGPFYLFKTEEIEYGGHNADARRWREEHGYFDHLDMKKGNRYRVIWDHDGKVRIGALKDGMHTRYGFDTYGTLVGETISGFWQPTPGYLSEEEMMAMIEVAKGKSTLPVFDPADLKDLSG